MEDETEMNKGRTTDKVSSCFSFRRRLCFIPCYSPSVAIQLQLFDLLFNLHWNGTKTNHKHQTNMHLDYVSIRRDQNYCFVPNNVYNHALCGLCPQVSLHLALRHQVSEPGGRASGFVTFTLGGSNYIRHLMTACWVDGTTWTLCAVCPLISPICYYFHKTPPSQETRKRLLNVCQPPSLIWGHKCSIRSNKSNATEAQP